MFFSVYTLGCKLNQLETEALADSFSREGFSFLPGALPGGAAASPGAEGPGLIIVNTCTVTSMAEQKARRVIRKALRDFPEACVVVTGCYAQLNREELAGLEGGYPRRLFVVPGDRKDRIMDLPGFLETAASESRFALPELLASWTEGVLDSPGESAGGGSFRFRPENFSSHSRGFMKIQDGCDRRCAYCRVSIARGKSRSLAPAEALEVLKALESRALGEAVLTGVNISRYRAPAEDTAGVMGLPGLLDFLLAGTGTIRLRLSSIEPGSGGDGFTDELIRAVKHLRIRPHFHLSLQSGSAGILSKMGRPYGPDEVEHMAERLRAVREDPFLACDIITGFPGETPEDFEKTFRLCERLRFAWIHAFPFSPRPGTAAYSMGGRVSERDAAARVNALTALARQGREEYIRRWTGKTVEAVVEAGEGDRSFVPAVSENYLKLRIDWGGGQLPAPGSLVNCRILEASADARFDARALPGDWPAP